MSINLIKEAYEIITENLDKTTEKVRQALMNEVPVHTGQLKQSIQAYAPDFIYHSSVSSLQTLLFLLLRRHSGFQPFRP